MTDEYDSWRRYEDAKAFKNKLAEIDQLKDRIERLEAALRNVVVTLDSEEIPYMVRNRYACATAKEALGDKNETVVI